MVTGAGKGAQDGADAKAEAGSVATGVATADDDEPSTSAVPACVSEGFCESTHTFRTNDQTRCNAGGSEQASKAEIVVAIKHGIILHKVRSL